MTVRARICYVLASLRIHNPDCEHCNARATCGSELLKRLEELNWQTLKTGEVQDAKEPAVEEPRKAS